jgi:hypothetical protein
MLFLFPTCRTRAWLGSIKSARCSLSLATVLPRSVSLQPGLRECVSQMRDHRQHAPATLRNRDSILGVLHGVLPMTGVVLEIASGTGEHVVHFAQNLAGLIFQPSDSDPDALLSVSAWVKATCVTNVRPPVILDAFQPPWPIASADGIICINMAKFRLGARRSD